METTVLEHRAAHGAKTKDKAIEEAKRAQTSVTEECTNAGHDPPPYVLSELIGKGSFGRVYKATDSHCGRLVAVKIISIEEGDIQHPRGADTFSDILKELGTLKLLSESGAKNINSIVDMLLVGQSVWMVTEYCAGGSVATLMKSIGGLLEAWIIPILREVAEALHWVHKQGIIHRDLKCANVFIAESGGVQLGDFGVAAIIDTNFDKRSTVTGTLNWMAPELFDSSVSYGTEIDIWAFGAIAFEAGSGLPPNASSGFIDVDHFSNYLKNSCPCLEGDKYSQQLKDIVACCMVPDPAQRPSIADIQRHPYIHDTADHYPTSSLSALVDAYKVWEYNGGYRQSLFSAGGAQGPTNGHGQSSSREWNFDITDEASRTLKNLDTRPAYDSNGLRVESHSFVPRARPRRRPPVLKAPPTPLEIAFDPHSTTSYVDNSSAFYRSPGLTSPSDLTLRDTSQSLAARESLIDLDAALDRSDLTQFVDLATIRAGYHSDHGRLQSWVFPKAALGCGFFQGSSDGEKHQLITQIQRSDDRSTDLPLPRTPVNRASMLSLIDLDDASRPIDANESSFASTAPPDTTPTAAHSPFYLEKYIFDVRRPSSDAREPSLYAPDGIGHIRWPSTHVADLTSGHNQLDKTPADQELPNFPAPADVECHPSGHTQLTLPSLPLMPSTGLMLGTSSHEDLKIDMQCMISSLASHLECAASTLHSLPLRRKDD